jgi:hypothetical protein
MIRALATPLAALALIGCATTGGGGRGATEVTRYHLGQPIAPGSVAVEPLASTGAISPEYRTYADGVAVELGRLGFAPVSGTAGTSDYIAAVGFQRASRGTVRTPPKFSIGIGGGSFGRGGGLGGGIGTGIGSTTREVLVSELFVQLRRRSDGTIVWEGRAQTGGLSGRADTQPVVTAGRLAAALFRGFPGESGITTTVR